MIDELFICAEIKSGSSTSGVVCIFVDFSSTPSLIWEDSSKISSFGEEDPVTVVSLGDCATASASKLTFEGRPLLRFGVVGVASSKRDGCSAFGGVFSSNFVALPLLLAV